MKLKRQHSPRCWNVAGPPTCAFDTPSKAGLSSHGRRTRHAPVGARRVYVPLGVMPIDLDPRPDGEDSAQSR